MSGLPIEAVLAEVIDALAETGLCVLEAPPGAGKTTRVPRALADAALSPGRILMLEPRRVAARGAAERLATSWGEQPGTHVGLRMRGTAMPGRSIEVVTEGLLTRMIQADPGLEGVGTVIFDEFHERSLQADLGLALCLEIRAALRPDLALLVMSATLDAAPVAALLGGAPRIVSAGRSFPIETRWLDRPLPAAARRGRAFDAAVAARVRDALAETEGGCLVFLPGKAEIARVAAALRDQLPANCHLFPLHGALPLSEQRRALTPLATGRKIVLSTAVAETSVTIPDVRVVVDAGLARRARFDPGSGMTRLVTERVTRAEATQRAGRAGRVAAGWGYRMWTRGEEGALAAFAPPEIAVADLAPLALDLALWGAREPGALSFLTPPPAPAFARARTLLQRLGALTIAGALTDRGRRMAALPVHPRLAAMLDAGGGKGAADLAAVLETRDLLGGPTPRPADLTPRLAALRPGAEGAVAGRPVDKAARAEALALAKRLRRQAGEATTGWSAGALLSLAYPDRIALRRPGAAPRFLLSGGAGAALDPGDGLAGQRMLVAADLDGDRTEARIRLALPVGKAEIRALHADALLSTNTADWSRRHRRVEARTRLMLGALILEDRRWADAGDAEIGPALLTGIRELGPSTLPWTPAARALQARVSWLRARGATLPDLSDAALIAADTDWLLPWLGGIRSLEDLATIDLDAALKGRLTTADHALIDRLAPAALTLPSGRRAVVDYREETPGVAVPLAEVFGTKLHPTLGPEKLPVVFSLLSPAGRPVQKTADLPAFWAGSYGDVRKELRSRYPKHDWPENPAEAPPRKGGRRR